MQILVFKTNLSDRRLVNAVEPHLENVEGILKWNVDLQDCDYVLRVISNSAGAGEITDLLLNNGHYCEELA